ncbi:SCO family protein [Rosettibacter firmus]|uniref:SCO family protein n=1 Tax=Rosettibacter firmus TaxID=3111522 RepID=UPI00336C0910
MKKINIILLTILFTISYKNHLSKNITQTNYVGIDEQLGKKLPLNLSFVTSENDTIQLNKLVDKPILLAFIYYECPGICSPMLHDVAWLIDKIDLELGVDYKIISLSIDSREKPEIANRWKRNYLQLIKKKINKDDWIFLTGDSSNIYKITKEAGYFFEKNKAGQIIHPAVLITLSPDGKIVRYILGPTFNPFDVKMALIEAKAGISRPTVTKVLELCYSYDPEGKKYAFNFLRVSGIIILFFIGIFLLILLLKSKKKMEQ